jgi:hypothetical protein
VPQAGQARASGLPHSPQNFAEGGLSVPQFGQFKSLPLVPTFREGYSGHLRSLPVVCGVPRILDEQRSGGT